VSNSLALLCAVSEEDDARLLEVERRMRKKEKRRWEGMEVGKEVWRGEGRRSCEFFVDGESLRVRVVKIPL